MYSLYYATYMKHLCVHIILYAFDYSNTFGPATRPGPKIGAGPALALGPPICILFMLVQCNRFPLSWQFEKNIGRQGSVNLT